MWFQIQMATIGLNDRTYNSFHVLATQKSHELYQSEIPHHYNVESTVEIINEGKDVQLLKSIE